MSHLSTTISGILSRQSKTYADLVRESGLSKSTLSKVAHGAPASPEVIQRLVSHISPERSHQAELVKAHLLDELERGKVPAGLVNIFNEHEPSSGEPIKGLLRADVYEWFFTIALAIADGNKEFEGILAHLAHLAQRFQKRKLGETDFDNPDGNTSGVEKTK